MPPPWPSPRGCGSDTGKNSVFKFERRQHVAATSNMGPRAVHRSACVDHRRFGRHWPRVGGPVSGFGHARGGHRLGRLHCQIWAERSDLLCHGWQTGGVGSGRGEPSRPCPGRARCVREFGGLHVSRSSFGANRGGGVGRRDAWQPGLGLLHLQSGVAAFASISAGQLGACVLGLGRLGPAHGGRLWAGQSGLAAADEGVGPGECAQGAHQCGGAWGGGHGFFARRHGPL